MARIDHKACRVALVQGVKAAQDGHPMDPPSEQGAVEAAWFDLGYLSAAEPELVAEFTAMSVRQEARDIPILEVLS